MLGSFIKRVPRSLILIGLVSAGFSQGSSAQQKLFWQIGQPDSNMRQFSLAPDRYRSYTKDGFYIVGKSDAATDWPYCHPGPQDSWAGNREHTFTVFFGVSKLASNGDCRLKFRLADVGNTDEQLSIKVNGQEYKSTLPEGAARSILGKADEGKKYAFEVVVPAAVLKRGDNKITITTVAGSWFVYDWVGFEVPEGIQQQSVRSTLALGDIRGIPFLSTHGGISCQSAELSVDNLGDSTGISVKVPGMEPQKFGVAGGSHSFEILAPAVTHDSIITIAVERAGKLVATEELNLQPVPKMTIYMLPHSHNDIGYTEIQTNVEKKQINNLVKGIEYARKTKDYPEGARFVWNLEGVYAADLYLQRMNEQQKKDFYEAVSNGQVALNGMYVNTLTGLCRPEELLNLFKRSTDLAQQCNVTVDAAMISDVPGYTWGTVTAMAQAGIKYFSVAPNYFDRIGDILVKWEDKPFYWLSPSGKEKVLVWIPYRGYALSSGIPHLSADFVSDYMNHLKTIDYPYDITYIRWSGHGDNAVPEEEISDFVKDWNTKYDWPRFIISSTSTAFHAFEAKFGDRLPRESGDWTGYWEDGAASSAFETAQNRASTERLTQAEALWAIEGKVGYPINEFRDAWQHAILYSEHTWGADMSVTNPLAQKTIEQWTIKKSYATTASDMSKELLDSATIPASTDPSGGASSPASLASSGAPTSGGIDVFNTNSWQRSSLVLVSPQLSTGGTLIKDENGVTIPAQRLSTGELAFVAKDVPPFAAKRFYISADQLTSNKPHSRKRVPAARSASADQSVPAAQPALAAPVAISPSGNTLDNGVISVSVDETTGAIKSLRTSAIDNNFVDSAQGNYINDYLFLAGNNLANLKRNGPVKISVKEKGPVLSTLLIESEAPGCNKLTREIRLVQGFDYVEMTNILDKKAAELDPHPGDYAWANTGGKESVNFGFPFNVAGGLVKLDIPMGIMQPEIDQIPGSCKNWLEVEQWADVSNPDFGVTWATLDAPLVEVGGITATLLGGQSNPAIWRKKIDPTQKLYSWALNNHWETNYRASQEGIITLRYAVKPHGAFDAVAATRFATGLAQPLVVTRAIGKEKSVPRLQLSSQSIIALVLKPSQDGKALIVTLYNPTNKPQVTALQWSEPIKATSYSNTGEMPLAPVTGEIKIEAQDVVTLRVEK